MVGTAGRGRGVIGVVVLLLLLLLERGGCGGEITAAAAIIAAPTAAATRFFEVGRGLEDFFHQVHRTEI